MKKSCLFIILVMFYLGGCTTLHRPNINSINSATGQSIEYEAIEKSCDSISFIITDNEESVNKRIKMLEEQISDLQNKKNESFSPTSYDEKIEKIQSQVNVLKKGVETFDITRKVFIEINSLPDRKYVFQDILEKSLLRRNIKIVDNVKDADVKFKIVVNQDGIDDKFYYFMIFYWSYVLEANVKMSVCMIDLKTNKVIMFTDAVGVAYNKQRYLFGFGPF